MSLLSPACSVRFVCVYLIVGMCRICLLSNRKRQKIWEACHGLCPGQSLTKEKRRWNREGAGEWKSVRAETVWKKWCVCAVSHRAWTGWLAREPLHACLWQLTLSLRQQTVNTTTFTRKLCNADYIITHHTHTVIVLVSALIKYAFHTTLHLSSV